MKLKSVHRALLIALLVTAYPAVSFAGFFGVGVGVNVGFAPPPMPVYAQPPCPAPGYLWTPGYWGYSGDDDDYYWVPGTWVMPPSLGLLWTPGYWGLVGEGYGWHEGYWGSRVGFYGGINYGFGYFGEGFEGGYWRGRDFFYNRAVMNVSNVNINNVYNRRVDNNNFYGNRPSFNGGNGAHSFPTHSDLTAARQPHFGITGAQRTQAAAAHSLPAALASVNHGRPQIAATQRPGAFHGGGVTRAGGMTGANGMRGSTARTAPAFGNRGQFSSASGRAPAAGARGYQAPRNYQAYAAPRSYQAPRNYQAYQAPRSYQAPRNYRAYQAPRNIQQAHYSAPQRALGQRHR